MGLSDGRDFDAEWDAETLAKAETIKGDSMRNSKALAASVKLAKEARDSAASMGKIANQQMFAKSAKDMGINVEQKT